MLKRTLGFWDSVAINIGIMIGVGIFRVPAEVAHYLDSPPLIIMAWLVGGVISLIGVLCYAELASTYPQSGGTYIYLREAYGRLVSFLYAWMEFSIVRPGSVASVAYILAAYLKNFLGMSAGTEKWIAVVAIICFTLINMAGLHFGTSLQSLLSTLKVLSLILMAGLIFAVTGGPFLESASPAEAFTVDQLLLVVPTLIPILWTYGGWNESTFMGGEFKDTKKALPFSLITGIALVTVLYAVLNTAYLAVLEPAKMRHSKAIAADVFHQLFGTAGMTMVTVAVLLSACSALNSTILTGARIPYAIGKDYSACRWFGHVSLRRGTPTVAFLINGLWASILALWGNFEQLVFFCGFAVWLVFMLVGASIFVIRYRQKEKLPDSFRMPGYPFVPFVFTLVSAGLCWATIRHTPREAFLGALLIAIGVPVYYMVRNTKPAQGIKKNFVL